MATKMNAATAKRVKALKINAKTEEEAREKLLEILNENGIEEMEGEETDTLLDIAESFVEDDDKEEAQTEEEENDELAEEVEEEEEEEKPKKNAKKASKKVVEEEPEEEEDDEEEEAEEDEDEGDQFDDMDRSALKSYIRENELDVTVKKSWSDDDIREAIRAAEGVDEEEDEKPAPKAKASTKPAAKAAPKKEEKAPAKAEKKTDKKEAKAKPAGKRGTKLDPKNNEEDREAFEALKDLFPEDEYAYAWVASAGVTIKHKGKNSQRSMVLIENCSKQADGSIKCNLYLLTFTKQTDVLDKAGIEYEPCWSGAPLIKAITLDEAIEIITELMPQISATVQKIDKKLGENRKKMEESLDKNKGAKKPSKKVEEPEEEEDEDDEEEEEAPKKKSSKAAPAKKAAKKVVEEDEEEDDEEEEDEAPAPKKKATSKAPVKKTTKKK